MADTISLFPNDGNKKTTNKSNYILETISETEYINEIILGAFPIYLIITNWYKTKELVY